MTADTARSGRVHGARALRLAPRAVGRDLSQLASEGLVRLSFDEAGLEPSARRALEVAALARRDGPGTRRTLLLPRARLEREDAADEGLDELLAAWDAAASPCPAPQLVGVLNLTPDSFSDGGELDGPAAAVARARALLEAGADLLDLGGESTRPGAEPISTEVELERVLPTLRALADAGLGPISIDTRRAPVAAAALAEGATIVNDVEAGTRDREMLPLVAESGCGYVAMHMRGDPRDMQQAPRYTDVVAEVTEFLRARLAACDEAGIDTERVWLDPGIGFGKTLEHNLALLARLNELRSLGRPLFVGVSRKRFIGVLTDEREPARRAFGTAGAIAACVAGGAQWLRVHDVAPMRAAARVAAAVVGRSAP
ncbi:dihydropteroate synthase [Engelhardtia mirabilis]|uniref:Dihydropteroate synthase n=1 Tax=Engelhardtia mirabilis TaxID=2528011 RepID=A0A518BNF9_9BACT|nr:Dihydropteroate synthase [Planctomycetes bacterium Pla133]QDV02844.1 Dihydropteroate synthase [Planctomycetes bacterium Pla86]